MAFPFFFMKILKLKENRDFRRVYNKGKSYVSPYFVVYINKNRFSDVRLGITAGKKIGNAVKRNRAKRVITAALSTICPRIITGYDFVIVARTKILTVKSTEVLLSLLKILKSIGMLENEENEKNLD